MVKTIWEVSMAEKETWEPMYQSFYFNTPEDCREFLLGNGFTPVKEYGHTTYEGIHPQYQVMYEAWIKPISTINPISRIPPMSTYEDADCKAVTESPFINAQIKASWE